MTSDNPCPEDNSHLPVEIKKGEGAYYFHGGEHKRYSPGFWEKVNKILPEGHEPKLTLSMPNNWGWPTVEFSCKTCGTPIPIYTWRQPANSTQLSPTGSIPKAVAKAISAHGQPDLVAPIHVWTAKGQRVSNKGYVVKGVDQARLLYPPNAKVYGDDEHYRVVVTSSYGKTKPKSYYASLSLEEALLSCQQAGYDYRNKGRELEFTNEVAAVRSSDEVANMIIALQQAANSDSLPALRAALKIVDGYLDNASLLGEMRDDLIQKMSSQFDLGDLIDE